MALPLALLRALQNSSPGDAWSRLFDFAWKVCAVPATAARAASEIPKRDAEVGSADLFLATAGWDLWRSFEKEVPRAADVLAAWWSGHTTTSGRAVLILDALSLREVPWILQCAAEQGYTIHQARAVGSELPADTTPFERAGFPRSQTVAWVGLRDPRRASIRWRGEQLTFHLGPPPTHDPSVEGSSPSRPTINLPSYIQFATRDSQEGPIPRPAAERSPRRARS